ncbi:MAG: ATP-binding protein [Myxococcales bacterium]|nr:ATP-binding protein [Myxococcales bacterium]
MAFLFGLLGVAHGGAASAENEVGLHDAAETDVVQPSSDGDVALADVVALRRTAAHVRSLTAGTLELEVEPGSLFDVALDEPRAILVEVVRLQAVVQVEPTTDAGAGHGDARDGAVPTDADAAEDGSLDALGSGATAPESLLRARLDLDRARLAFYLLPAETRKARLLAHLARQEAARAARPETEAEQRAREAEAARKAALEAARKADTEAARLISEEYVRLLEVERAQAALVARLADESKQVGARRESTLRWQRRLRGLKEARAAGQATDLDAVYDELRTSLRASRGEFAAKLDDAANDSVPVAGPNPLEELHLGSDQVQAQRNRVEAESKRLRLEQQLVREASLAQLLEETTTLNKERLALLPLLSPEKRRAVTGFTAEGRDQAAAELRQVTLILRYHRHVAVGAIRRFRQTGEGLKSISGRGVVSFLEFAALVAAFVWWRRRAPEALANWRARSSEEARHRTTTADGAVPWLDFLTRVRGPFEWLALVMASHALLPASLLRVLEVEVVFVIATWTFAGRLVVDIIDAAAADRRSGASTQDSTALRHRSLRLVGRVTVGFGVVLVLTARTVGQGAIYEWVVVTCWFASIPVFLTLIHWWRDVVFARLERRRRPSAFERWVLRHHRGWTSFVAAAVGGIYLFSDGIQRAVRGWVGRFEISRRVLAYLFRRRLDRLKTDTTSVALGPLDPGIFTILGPPERPANLWIESRAQPLAALVDRIQSRRGGLVALVGERGMGKTSLLQRIQQARGDVASTTTPPAGLAALCELLVELDVLAGGASLRQGSARPAAILLDDFQRIAQPAMGGLRDFDRLLAFASRHCEATTWVFAFDEVMWQFLERARATRPSFDEVMRLERWTEEDIARLLKARTELAGVAPSFERLLEPLAPSADETDRQEALTARAASYYRLMWDHAAGNPGVALDLFRRSLGVDPAGVTFVRPFQALELSDLERLPDSAIFVLKAVLQLAPAATEAIVHATNLRPTEVNDALRYSLARGYLEEADGRFTVTWTWFRAATVFLQRRHLLVSP